LESHIANLNKAIYQKRKANKELKASKEEKPEVQLSHDQLKQLFREHADDPDALCDMVDHMIKQGMAKGTQEAVDVTELSRRKQIHDNYVYNAWPDLAKEDSELRTQANTVRDTLGIDNHPMGDYLAMGAILVEQLPNIQKEAYEKGKADALKVKADGQRKQGIKDNALTSPGIPAKSSGDGLTDSQRETMNMFNMSDERKKIYIRLLKKKGN